MGEAIVLDVESELSALNRFDCTGLSEDAVFDPGLDNGEPGSCSRLILLLVSCQNLADTTIPRGAFFSLAIPPTPHSCRPEVSPEDTLSVSEVPSQKRADGYLTEFPSDLLGSTLSALPISKLNLPSNGVLLLSTIIDCCIALSTFPDPNPPSFFLTSAPLEQSKLRVKELPFGTKFPCRILAGHRC